MRRSRARDYRLGKQTRKETLIYGGRPNSAAVPSDGSVEAARGDIAGAGQPRATSEKSEASGGTIQQTAKFVIMLRTARPRSRLYYGGMRRRVLCSAQGRGDCFLRSFVFESRLGGREADELRARLQSGESGCGGSADGVRRRRSRQNDYVAVSAVPMRKRG